MEKRAITAEPNVILLKPVHINTIRKYFNGATTTTTIIVMYLVLDSLIMAGVAPQRSIDLTVAI